MKAVVILPVTAPPSDLFEGFAFADRLRLRGYEAEVVRGAEYGVELAGVAHSYHVLRRQSLGWTALREIRIKRLTQTAILPTRGSLDCAGLDLYADIPTPIQAKTNEVVRINTGIALECPRGHYAQIKDRSSMGARGFAIRGGVIDHDYRGEVVVMLQFLSPVLGDGNASLINVNEKVAQVVFLPYMGAQVVEAPDLSVTIRDSQGWGSSGR